MGAGLHYQCACGYHAMTLQGPLMFSGDSSFEGATCDSCREFVSVSRNRRDHTSSSQCPTCKSPVRLFRDQERLCCPHCGRHDGWEPVLMTMAD